jgi:hypothetical protein
MKRRGAHGEFVRFEGGGITCYGTLEASSVPPIRQAPFHVAVTAGEHNAPRPLNVGRGRRRAAAAATLAGTRTTGPARGRCGGGGRRAPAGDGVAEGVRRGGVRGTAAGEAGRVVGWLKGVMIGARQDIADTS